MTEAIAGKIGEYRVYQEDGGTIRVDVRAPKIPNQHGGQGFTLEHASTTRARALKLARSVLPGAVIVSAFRHDHMIGSQWWREYVVEVPAGVEVATPAAEVATPAADGDAVRAFSVNVHADQTPEPADIESALSFAYGWTVTAVPLTETESRADLGALALAFLSDPDAEADDMRAQLAIRAEQLGIL